MENCSCIAANENNVAIARTTDVEHLHCDSSDLIKCKENKVINERNNLDHSVVTVSVQIISFQSLTCFTVFF